jgi:hypothetical protein
MQTKRKSFVEACTQTAIGFVVTWFASLIIYPMNGVEMSMATNLKIVGWFTVVSVIRGYFVRRYFNHHQVKEITRETKSV